MDNIIKKALKQIEMEFNHKPTNKRVKIHKASKYNLKDVNASVNL